MYKIQNYINGKVLESESTNFLKIYNPTTGELQGEVVNSNDNDFELLIKSSSDAFSEWCNETPLRRSRILSKYKNLIEKNLNDLAKLISSEHGKTFEDAKGSVTRGLGC